MVSPIEFHAEITLRINRPLLKGPQPLAAHSAMNMNTSGNHFQVWLVQYKWSVAQRCQCCMSLISRGVSTICLFCCHVKGRKEHLRQGWHHAEFMMQLICHHFSLCWTMLLHQSTYEVIKWGMDCVTIIHKLWCFKWLCPLGTGTFIWEGLWINFLWANHITQWNAWHS